MQRMTRIVTVLLWLGLAGCGAVDEAVVEPIAPPEEDLGTRGDDLGVQEEDDLGVQADMGCVPNGTTNPCEPDACVPMTCSDLGATCGMPDDGCGGQLACGGCEGTAQCREGTCVPAECTPASCGELAACGPTADGCGGMLSCPPCEDTCSATPRAVLSVKPESRPTLHEMRVARDSGAVLLAVSGALYRSASATSAPIVTQINDPDGLAEWDGSVFFSALGQLTRTSISGGLLTVFATGAPTQLGRRSFAAPWLVGDTLYTSGAVDGDMVSGGGDDDRLLAIDVNTGARTELNEGRTGKLAAIAAGHLYFLRDTDPRMFSSKNTLLRVPIGGGAEEEVLSELTGFGAPDDIADGFIYDASRLVDENSPDGSLVWVTRRVNLSTLEVEELSPGCEGILRYANERLVCIRRPNIRQPTIVESRRLDDPQWTKIYESPPDRSIQTQHIDRVGDCLYWTDFTDADEVVVMTMRP